jgi:hypothetical protein
MEKNMNNSNQNKIVWMMDETIANTNPNNWHRVRELERELVTTIGNSSFMHEIVDPIPCLQEMVRQLKNQKFSCILDLTGWLTPAMQELFPNTPIENRFSLSRVRVVSSPKLETTGYKISMSPKEIEEVKRNLNLSHPLVVDDVSFSGWTSRKTMEIWGLEPKNTTHAFLIANTGNLGSDPGAVPMLFSLGSNVIFGYELKTPQDDGWHLKDLHQNPNLDQAFILALLFQEAVKKDGIESALVQKFFKLETVIKTVFPEHLTSVQIRELMQEGKFILRNGNVINGDEIHARNPFLWASPYFQEHVDIGQILLNKDHIISLLGELRTLTTDPEGKAEASFELQKEVRKFQLNSPEGQFTRGKEKL